MRKTISSLLTITILFSMILVSTLQPLASDIALELNEEKEIFVTSGSYTVLTFTPEVDDYYAFSSYSQNFDTYCEVYDDEFNSWGYSDDYDDSNFSYRNYLYSGITYRFYVTIFDENTTTSLPVMITQIEEPEEDKIYNSGNGFEYIKLKDNSIQIMNYTGSCSFLEIPSKIDGYDVTRIGDFAFSNCESLTTLTLPNSLEYINDFAFSQCTGLTEIIIPSSVKHIGVCSFMHCTNLSKITVLSYDTKIFDSAFGYFWVFDEFENGSYRIDIVDKCTIYGYKNSTAQTYADLCGINFISLGDYTPEVTYPLGDVNLSGAVDITDATAIQRHLADLIILSDEQMKYSDTNHNNQLDILDATRIQMLLAELITEL